MNILKKGSLAWWQMGLLKLSVISIGITIGANWPEVFEPHTLFLVILGIVLGLYVASAWYGKK